MTILAELPDEIRQVIELKQQQNEQRIDALSAVVAKMRDEAVSARKESGIERIWEEDEEFYLGIDDANRAGNVYTKSMSNTGGLSNYTSKDNENRCTAFFNITRQFVDSASARMGDILLPAGDWNFSIKPTPIPDIESIKGSSQPVVDPATGQPKENQDGTPYTLGQFEQQETSESAKKVTKAETRIRDWLVECNYHSEVRKVIEDAAKIGSGVLRGAYPVMRKSRVVANGALVIEEKIFPSSKRVDPRNFYPDPSCGDNIQNGNYVIEKDKLSARQLRDLCSDPSYKKDRIEKVLKEGPGKCHVDSDETTKEGERFEVWYFFGAVDIEDLKALGNDVADSEEKVDLVSAVVVMVNDTIIKAFLNPLDNGEFPYDVMPWQRMSDSVWGVGVSRQGRTAQEMLLASARALMNNAGLSSAPQIILRQSAIVPSDGEWTLVAGKVWFATEEADIKSVADAFIAITIPSMQQELAAIIQMAYKMMEDATGISFLLQGQQGSAPDTVGGMQLLHTNSSALLRRIARVFDECVTEPHIRRYYDWLLIHGEDDEKGDLKIEAVGSTSLVEREIQSQQAAQILQMSLNPVFGMSPKKASDELLRAWRFDPNKFELDEEEKNAAQQQGQAPAPQVQAAQIRAETDKAIADQRAQTEMQKVKLDTDRDTAYNQSIINRDRMTFEQRSSELQLRRELALMEYANKHQLKLEDIKVSMATTAMKLRTQKELAIAGSGQQAITPPTEPAGRARPGHAFAE